MVLSVGLGMSTRCVSGMQGKGVGAGVASYRPEWKKILQD